MPDKIMPTKPRNNVAVEILPSTMTRQRGPEIDLLTGSYRLSGETLISVIENYIHYYAAGANHTSRAKRYDLQHFILFLAGSKNKIERVLVSDWTLQATKDFIDQRLGLGEAPATVGRRLATIKHFGRTLAERVPGYINPAREVKSPGIQQTKPHGLSPQEIELLRETASLLREREDNSFNSIRNQLVLEMLLATGLRADEVRLLVMNQISEDLHWLKNVKTKGRKFRNVYLDSQIRQLLKEYILAREKYLKGHFKPLLTLPMSEQKKFPVLISLRHGDIHTPGSLGLAPKTLWRIIADFGKHANLVGGQKVKHLHPHKLRHTFAHGLLDSSKDVRLVAQALGHSDVRTTMRYTERAEEEIARAIEKKVNKYR
ncbi:MAG: tyrosine-type recombinase/integrase [Deltaproteobacteria bacterium]|nr:tyrosine-type recombinase/integrase [Deltaproteobacteria bacterium]